MQGHQVTQRERASQDQNQSVRWQLGGDFLAILPRFPIHASLELFSKTEIKFLKPLKNHTKWTVAHLPGAQAVGPRHQRWVLI